jgi:hypothetical protein
MGKKIMCLLFVGLVVALVIPVGSAQTSYEAKLFAIGLIKIDSLNHEIRGFVVYGIIDGDVILLKNINIKYDGATPIFVGGVIPLFVHHIYYNPAK